MVTVYLQMRLVWSYLRRSNELDLEFASLPEWNV